jgi:hypothetical protein
MTGHFEKGAWIEDAHQPIYAGHQEIMHMDARVKIHVDDSELQKLKGTLDEIRHVMNPPVTFWGRIRWLLFGNGV